MDKFLDRFGDADYLAAQRGGNPIDLFDSLNEVKWIIAMISRYDSGPGYPRRQSAIEISMEEVSMHELITPLPDETHEARE
jgi:hypothetical protein